MKTHDELVELSRVKFPIGKGKFSEARMGFREGYKQCEQEQLNLHLVSKRFWYFDTWDRSGKTKTITIEALNETNATIILKATHEDIAFDKPY